MGLFDIFRNKGNNAEELLSKGALVLDVRTVAEYRAGHGKNTHNCPIGRLEVFLNSHNPEDGAVVTCCATGMRSGKAARILQSHGFTVANGGNWRNVEKMKSQHK